jgi:hypothetical protein
MQPSGGFRQALSGLTTRGRSFLAAGLAAEACAYVLGQPELLRVGLLLTALPPFAPLAALARPSAALPHRPSTAPVRGRRGALRSASALSPSLWMRSLTAPGHLATGQTLRPGEQ